MTTKLDAVETVCAELAAGNTKVTFAAVAERTGISRTTLYNHPELRAVIDEHREPSSDPRTLTSLMVEIGYLRTAVEAIATRVGKHEDRLRRLEHRQRRQQAG